MISQEAFCKTVMIDNVAKSRKIPLSVIPAEAETQYFQRVKMLMGPGFHRGDDFLRSHHD